MKTTLCILVIFALYGLALAELSPDADQDVSKVKTEPSKPDVPKGPSADADGNGQNVFGKMMHIPSDMMQAGAQVTRKIENAFLGTPDSAGRSNGQTKNEDKTKDAKDD